MNAHIMTRSPGPTYCWRSVLYFSGGGEAQSVGFAKGVDLDGAGAGFPFFCRAATATSERGEAAAGGIGRDGGPFLADGQGPGARYPPDRPQGDRGVAGRGAAYDGVC